MMLPESSCHVNLDVRGAVRGNTRRKKTARDAAKAAAPARHASRTAQAMAGGGASCAHASVRPRRKGRSATAARAAQAAW